MQIETAVKTPVPSSKTERAKPVRLDEVLDTIGQLVNDKTYQAKSAKAESRQAGQKQQQFIADCWRQLEADFGPRYRACTLDGFELYHANQTPVVEAVAKVFMELSQFIADGRGLIFYGPCGTGKDHLAAVLLGEAVADGLSARWINGRRLYADIKDSYGSEITQQRLRLPYLLPDVLCISDPALPSGLSKDNADNLYILVEERSRQCKSTWITLNVDSHERAREVLTTQVYSRLRDNAVELFCNWPDYRERSR